VPVCSAASFPGTVLENHVSTIIKRQSCTLPTCLGAHAISVLCCDGQLSVSARTKLKLLQSRNSTRAVCIAFRSRQLLAPSKAASCANHAGRATQGAPNYAFPITAVIYQANDQYSKSDFPAKAKLSGNFLSGNEGNYRR
jgi:hypothetical protein